MKKIVGFSKLLGQLGSGCPMGNEWDLYSLSPQALLQTAPLNITYSEQCMFPNTYSWEMRIRYWLGYNPNL